MYTLMAGNLECIEQILITIRLLLLGLDVESSANEDDFAISILKQFYKN